MDRQEIVQRLIAAEQKNSSLEKQMKELRDEIDELKTIVGSLQKQMKEELY